MGLSTVWNEAHDCRINGAFNLAALIDFARLPKSPPNKLIIYVYYGTVCTTVLSRGVHIHQLFG